MDTFIQLHGYELDSDYMNINDRIDNNDVLEVVQSIGLKASGDIAHGCIMAATVFPRELIGGIRMDVCNGSETVYIDENAYVISKLAKIQTDINPGLYIQSYKSRCRELTDSVRLHF